MFQHPMKRHSHHGWERSPWGNRRGGPRRPFGPDTVNPANPELRSLFGDVRDLGRYLFRQGTSGALNDTDKVRQLRDIVARTRTDIETLFGPESSTIV